MSGQPKLYKPVILKLADIGGMNSLRIFLLILLTLGPVAYFLNTPLSTIIILAYCCSLANFVTKRCKLYLQELRPVLKMPDQLFECYAYRMDHVSRLTIVLAAIAVPFAFLLTNRNSVGMSNLFAGRHQGVDFYFSFCAALLTWFIIWQLVSVLIANISKFRDLALNYARIDLINTTQLAPFLMVGVSSFWIFGLSWTIIPIAFIQDRALLTPSIISMLLTLPIALMVLVIPGWSIRQRIRKARLEELDLVKQALSGNMEALRDSRLREEIETVTTTSLVQYRQWLKQLSDLPMDDTVLRKMFVYFVIPASSWTFAFMFEQVVESYL